MDEKGLKAILYSISAPVISILCSLFLGGIIIALLGINPLEAYAALWNGAFGSSKNLAETLSRTTPIIFTGLAVAVPFHAGLFNIGAEGQMLVGGLVAGWIGFAFTDLPRIVHVPMALVGAMLAGGIWGGIPGILKAKIGVHEVINTIMMNFIAFGVTAYAVIGPLRAAGQIPKTPNVSESARLLPITTLGRLNSGLYVAILALVVTYLVLSKTVWGYELRASGKNRNAAETAGISVANYIFGVMVAGGLLAGLAGAERVLGFHRSFIHGFSPGFGFEGIAVALLGRNHPLGVFLAALLFGALSRGGLFMDLLAGVPSDLVVVIQAIVIFFIAVLTEIIGRLAKRRLARGGVF